MRNKLKIIPLLIALLIVPQQAGAESPAAVGIKESINLTLENNASLLSLKQEIIKAADTLVIYGTHLSVDRAIDLLDAK